MEAAVYMYRPTREAGFLKKLLRDFKGVLVTDFYTGYDSLDCRQQRCLIHLMRDMNQELLESPFDNDLQDVTRDFGKLLRATVNSVDKLRLKKRHLRKHDRAVRNFFAALEEKVFTSDAAKNLQVRLLKNKAKLFTFVGCDGVSWNNNCAENAIKYLAYYRHNREGALTERGIQDYLVLLSLCQTCRYRGIRFLPFMLSRHRDIETFSKPRRKRRQTNVEVYPKGFIPLFGTSPAKT